MSEKLQYELSVGVSGSTDIEALEETLQDILLDLYDHEGVDSIQVTKSGHVKEDAELPRIIEIVDALDSGDIKRAIDSVKELEEMAEEEDEGD